MNVKLWSWSSVAVVTLSLTLPAQSRPAFEAVAQDARPQFDVASIKIVPDGATGFVRFTVLPGGRVVLRLQTLNNIIRQTLTRDVPDIVGIPEWARMVRYDIDATIPGGQDTSTHGMFARLRTLLESRFNLRWHIEQREMPVFDMVLDKPGQTGARLTRSDIACDGDQSFLQDRELAPAVREDLLRCSITMGRTPGVGRGGRGQSSGADAVAFWRMKGRTLDQVALDLHRILGVDRTVRNLTGLQGRFDINVEYAAETADLLTGSGGVILAGLREQLGLRLEPATAAIDVVVVDSVSRASEN